MCDEQTVRIEGEEIVRVSIPMPKKFVEFIKEFGEWTGIDESELNEYIGEYIIESIKASMGGFGLCQGSSPSQIRILQKQI